MEEEKKSFLTFSDLKNYVLVVGSLFGCYFFINQPINDLRQVINEVRTELKILVEKQNECNNKYSELHDKVENIEKDCCFK